MIDYHDSTDNEPNAWTFRAFKQYFDQCYRKTHKVGGAIPWTMKETSQLSRIMKEFNAQDLADMIVYWHLHAPKAIVASSFSLFYNLRIEVYHKMKEATGEFTWE